MVCVLGLRLDVQPKTDVHKTSVLGLRLDDQPKTDVHKTSVLGLRLDVQPKPDVHKTSVLGLRLGNQPSLCKYMACSHNFLHLTTPAPMAAVGHFHGI
jgi:hypothetical protein